MARLTVNIQPDGDLMYAPGVLWSAAHHHIPLLAVLYNCIAPTVKMLAQVQTVADRHSRGVDRAGIGTTLTDPNIDYFQGGARHGYVCRRDPLAILRTWRLRFVARSMW